jgi:hypothetical protein
MDNKWIPEWATHFSMLKSNHGLLTIKFHEGSPAFNVPEDAVFSGITELPAMLSRADVCQQIADKPLADRMEPRNKYDREITPGLWVDVYDVLDAFKVTRSAVAHAVKKLLAPGQRGVKSEIADLKEARDSIDRAIQKLDEWV